MADARDVAITGLGAVTPFGRGVETLWSGLTAGRSAVREIAAFDASSFPSRIAGEVRDYEPPRVIDHERASRLDRGSLFAVDAAVQALEDAALPLTPENAVHVACVIGSARPGEEAVWRGHAAYHEGGAPAVTAGHVPRTLSNAPAAEVAAALGVRGTVLGAGAGGASAHAAIAHAAALVRNGDAQVAVAGGADAAITPVALAAFCAMRILAERNDAPDRACRPFDADADGFPLAEGAGVLVLEDEALARQRGARIYARLSGAASVTEPMVGAPTAAEAGRALQSALRQPALLQGEIDYVCAYGSASPGLDRMETDAVKRIFGELTASRLTLSAPKSMLGHMLGASGAVDAIVCAKAIETGVVPPTINLARPAEGCDLDYTPGEARRMAVRHALSYAFGFGGHHLALCFSAP